MSRLRLRLRAGRPLPSRQDSRTPFSFHGRRMRTPRRSFGFPPPHKALSAEGVTDSNEKNGNEGSSGRRSSDTETVLLEVTGMRCGGCSANVKRTLLEHPQVTKASVNLLTGTAAITLKGMLDEEETESEEEFVPPAPRPSAACPCAQQPVILRCLGYALMLTTSPAAMSVESISYQGCGCG